MFFCWQGVEPVPWALKIWVPWHASRQGGIMGLALRVPSPWDRRSCDLRPPTSSNDSHGSKNHVPEERALLQQVSLLPHFPCTWACSRYSRPFSFSTQHVGLMPSKLMFLWQSRTGTSRALSFDTSERRGDARVTSVLPPYTPSPATSC